MTEQSDFTVENWPSSKIRQTFIDFFKQREHDFIPSCPVVSFLRTILHFFINPLYQLNEETFSS